MTIADRLNKWKNTIQYFRSYDRSRNQQRHSGDHLPHENPPAILHPFPDEATQEAEHKKHDRQYKNRQTFTNVFVVLFTAVTAGSSIWQGILTRDAIKSNNRQSAASEASNDVAKTSISSNLSQNRAILESSASQNASILNEAARENREALHSMENQQVLAFRQGKDALELSKTNFIADQRAWIGVIDVPALQFEAGDKVTFQVVISNFGKSIAKSMTVRVQESAFPWGTVFVATFPSEVTSEKSSAVVFPNAKITVPLTTKTVVTVQDIRNIESGLFTIRYWGRINYLDNFENPRETVFCVYLAKDRKSLPFCDTYNDAN